MPSPIMRETRIATVRRRRDFLRLFPAIERLTCGGWSRSLIPREEQLEA